MCFSMFLLNHVTCTTLRHVSISSEMHTFKLDPSVWKIAWVAVCRFLVYYWNSSQGLYQEYNIEQWFCKWLLFATWESFPRKMVSLGDKQISNGTGFSFGLTFWNKGEVWLSNIYQKAWCYWARAKCDLLLGELLPAFKGKPWQYRRRRSVKSAKCY